MARKSRMNYELYGSILSSAIDRRSKELLGVKGPKDFDKKYAPRIRAALNHRDMGTLKSVVVSHVAGTLENPEDEMVRFNIESFTDEQDNTVARGRTRRCRHFITLMVKDRTLLVGNWQKEMLDRNGLWMTAVGGDGGRRIKGYLETRIEQRHGDNLGGFIQRRPHRRHIRNREGILVRVDNQDFAVQKDTRRNVFYINKNDARITYTTTIARHQNPFPLTPAFAE